MSSVSFRPEQPHSTIVLHGSRLLGLLALTSLLAAVIASANLPLLGRDFLLFWTSARAVQDGHSPYDLAYQAATQQANGWDVSRERMPFNPYSYPPWLAISLWPLARLPYETAFHIWLAMSIVAFTLALMILVRVASRSVSIRPALIVLVLGFTFLPALNGLSVGQLNLALFASLAGMIWGLERRMDWLAGMCMGLMLTKPHIGLVVVAVMNIGLIAHRRIRPLSWAGVTLAVCLLMSFAATPNWIDDMLSSFDKFTALTGWTFPLNGYQDNPTAYAVARVSLESNPMVLILLAAALAGMMFLLIRSLHRGETPSLQWFSAAACIAVFVFAPYARAYDLTFLLWPMIYFVFSGELDVPAWLRRGLGLALYVMPIVFVLLEGQGVSNFIWVYALALALLIPRRGARHSMAP